MTKIPKLVMVTQLLEHLKCRGFNEVLELITAQKDNLLKLLMVLLVEKQLCSVWFYWTSLLLLIQAIITSS